jgi:hypothetical protein
MGLWQKKGNHNERNSGIKFWLDFQKESIQRPDQPCIGSPNWKRLFCGDRNFARQGFFSLGQGQVGAPVFDSGIDPVLIDGFGKGELTVIFSNFKFNPYIGSGSAFYFDLLHIRFRKSLSGKVDGQNTIYKYRLDTILGGIFRQGQNPLKGTIGTLNPVVIFTLLHKFF